MQTGDAGQRPRLTARGRATRTRILETADRLTYRQGVAWTTVEDVTTASGTSKSQFYQHFTDKDALIHEVIALRAQRVLHHQARRLERVDSVRGLERWRDSVLRRIARGHSPYGCELGSLVNELAGRDEYAREALAQHFSSWQGLLAAGINRMRDNGALRPEADPNALATCLMAALQGGYLLSQTTQDGEPMRLALDMALTHVRSFSS
jgi:TetR/AcrR family transcriptional repressor of nem operon